jgi:hydroxypyruvate reductase
MNQRPPDQLRRDALQIWQAGVDAVGSERLVRSALRVEGRTLLVGDDRLDLDRIGRIAVVGAGKAGAGMAAAVEDVLGPRLMDEKQLAGWVNVPEDCVRPLARIRLHGSRPPGVNEPTEAGAAGATEILRLVASLSPSDLCLCLISGGGSALMPAPVEGITLADKLAVTRHLSAAGANIEELNTVRKQLSRIKGGGLARACCAGRLVALLISDVLGDPLDVIASGPTVHDWSTPEAALAVLDRFRAAEAGISPRVFEHLERKRGQNYFPSAFPFHGNLLGCPDTKKSSDPFSHVTNLVIGNNATAVDAAGQEAVRLGYSPAMVSARNSEGHAEEVGRHLAGMARRMRDESGPDCLVSGGEPVVKLVEAARRGLGGRNQQLVLAAAEVLWDDAAQGLVLLSGGTDGEDGPTDAAGALLDAEVLQAARLRGFDPRDFLARNDAYHFFAPLGSLIHTGPTHTNVCDLRVVVVNRQQ